MSGSCKVYKGRPVQHKIDMATEAMKATPPVAVASAGIMGMDVPQLIQLLTLLYLVAQLGLTIINYWGHIKAWLSKRVSPPSAPRE